MITILPYNLPDINVLHGQPDGRFFVWQPDRTYLVLGRSNDASALKEEAVAADGVTVMKRPSGGETVLLTPKMLVLATLMPVREGMKPRDYFMAANDRIIRALERQGVRGLSTRGISDISIGDKKILGSAVYRYPRSVFYHAVLNVAEDVALIVRYIRHPKREPDYRRGRTHGDFVTSLTAAGFTVDVEKVVELLRD